VDVGWTAGVDDADGAVVAHPATAIAMTKAESDLRRPLRAIGVPLG
jgi:hypothetical protein